ncbi:MAG: hypothetical protein ABI461_18905, partial [Polyangiaceae bacterium]
MTFLTPSRLLGALFTASCVLVACSSHNSVVAGNDGGIGATCSTDNKPVDADFCSTCSPVSGSACTAARPIDACCTYVQAPKADIARGTGLHYFSSNDPAVDVGCLASPPAAGPSQNITLAGYVKLFASGNDSQGVKIEVFQEGANGALGALVGSYTTSGDDAADPPQMPLPTWSTKCPEGGCKLRTYFVANVPTETPLIIKTSDATASGQWSDLYDYNIYIANGAAAATSPVPGTGIQGFPTSGSFAEYDASTVAGTDVNTVASAAGGLTVAPGKGVIAGEVHDCGDVRISGATVDTDAAHDGPLFYFNENESDPTPDQSRGPQGIGTSNLGLFGALNLATGTPIHVSAVGHTGGQTVLLGTYTVQVYAGAVTALSFRGRRP